MKDALGERMKMYENKTRLYLPKNTYTLIRIDGKAFHTYTKGLKKPYDNELIDDMDSTAKHLCKNIQGAKFAFVQSDEISILVTDFDKITTDMWFHGNIQKICSVSSSIATAKFNQMRMLTAARNNDDPYCSTWAMPFQQTLNMKEIENFRLAEFDSRTWTIEDKYEVINYFIWRQQDTIRNSVSSCAQAEFSHKRLHGKNQDDMQEMLLTEKGIDWENLSQKLKQGRFIMRQPNEHLTAEGKPYIRNEWVSVECPVFTQDKEFLDNKIPNLLPDGIDML